MALSRIRGLLLVVTVALMAAAPAHAATGCDATGDARSADDCVRHAHVGPSLDGRVWRGEIITLRQRLDPSLRGATIVSRIQVRHAPIRGRKGPWIEIRRVRWTPGARGMLDIDACRAKLAGRYEFRTAVTPTATPRLGLLDRATAPLTTSAPTTVTLPPAQLACSDSANDEANVAYFNEMRFMDAYAVQVVSTGTTYAITLECPERESPTVPSTDYGIALTLIGQRTGVGCTDSVDATADAIVVDLADLQRGAYPECSAIQGRYTCTFMVIAYNLISGTEYSTTEIQIILEPQEVIPNLEPATLPVCNSTVECVDGRLCILEPPPLPIVLCDSAMSCTTPPPRMSPAGPAIYVQSLQPTGS